MFAKKYVLLMALALLMAAALFGGVPTVRCVDPDDAGCFATIQAAVDASASGDEVEVRLPGDGRPYNESVTIGVADLTVYGSESVTFEVDTFEELQAVDFDAEKAQCSPVTIDPCDSSACQAGPTFEITAPGVTIQRLTTRFSQAFLRLEGDVDGVTLEDSCFIKGASFIEALSSGEETPDNLTIRRNRAYSAFRGSDIHGNGLNFSWNLLRRHDGLDIVGDDATVRSNFQFLTEDGFGFHVIGRATQMLDNISKKTTGYGLLLEGDNVTVTGNLVEAVAPRTRHASGIRIAAIGDAADDPQPVPASNATVEGNTIRNTFGPGLILETDDSSATQNVIESTGSPQIEQTRRAAALEVLGSRNQVRNNTVRRSGGIGIVVGGGSFATDNNVIGNNTVEDSSTSGIVIVSGGRTRAQNNTLTGSDGEGFGNLAAAQLTSFIGNMLSGNRMDLCNCGSLLDLSGNTFATGGSSQACVVERDAIADGCPESLFVDDFESGDFSRWSASQP